MATAEIPVDRCPRCRCGDCGGRLDQHTATGCGCADCKLSWMRPCRLAAFTPPERVYLLAQQLGPLLSSHLDEKAARRCLAVAHAAHHALNDYDHPEESDDA
ncbi:hypothetical protein [Streptacidiphilus cavernicola]|uniref:Uncharacterized protein n=1 Tax=Streptacidiphilus cavernicola TaxID=3342716 RepID=A0ABV6W4U5_9ACTN